MTTTGSTGSDSAGAGAGEIPPRAAALPVRALEPSQELERRRELVRRSGIRVRPSRPRQASWRRPLTFLVLSAVSMFLAWHWSSWQWTYPWLSRVPTTWADGLVYTLALLAIFAFHEFGHYLQAIRCRMAVSWPYMIPMPPPLNPFGTLGAVIVSVEGYRNRRDLFDVGVSGPLAGLLIALPLLVIGLAQATPVPADPFFGEMLGMRLLSLWLHGPLPAGHVLPLNPLATAGWVGLFFTGLNLLPLGQLDGGHTAYALLGRKAVLLAWGVLFGWLAMMVLRQEYQLVLMLVLVLLTGVEHPPTADDSVPLDPLRTVIGWLALLLPLLCLTPVPLQGI